jgi:hypothetical protein
LYTILIEFNNIQFQLLQYFILYFDIENISIQLELTNMSQQPDTSKPAIELGIIDQHENAAIPKMDHTELEDKQNRTAQEQVA